MKRLLTLAAMFLCCMATTFAQFSGSGSGTENDPYLILNPIHLNQLRNYLNQSGVYFKLMADIDLAEFLDDENPSQGWQPVGSSSAAFKGIVDGNGKTVSGLWIKRTSTDYVGFFGNSDGATIKNLKIVATTIVGKDNVGGMSGYSNNSTFSGCSFSGEIQGGACVGGYVGNSGNNLTLSGNDALVNVTGTGNYVGGFIGKNSTNTVSDCKLNGTIVKGADYVGGCCGGNSESSNYSITNTYIHADISGNNYVGGICGYNRYHISINGCGYVGNITGTGNVGGLVGYLEKTSTYSIDYIQKSFAIGRINVEGDNVGGLIGYDKGYKNYGNSIISDSYFSGSVAGKDNVGGLIGIKNAGGVRKSYAVATVAGVNNVGGIIGYNSSSSSIETSVAINTRVTATEGNVGRIVGLNKGTIAAIGSSEENKSYNRTIVISQGVAQDVEDNLLNGTGVSATTLKLKATYVAMGWDFTDTWEIQETECYPYMKSQTAPPVITSQVVSGATTVSGKCVDGGTVTLEIDGVKQQMVSTNHEFSFTVSALQAGHEVRVSAKADGKEQSYYTTEMVAYLGKGTEADPYQVYTASDLTGVYRKGYFKLMNDIDLTDYINQFSPTEGWESIGRDGSETIHFDGDNHKITGLWCNSTRDNTGLFSCFANGTIKNLTVETAKNKQVKGGANTGILIGKMMNGTIENCRVSGKVADGTPVGGLVGLFDGGKISLSQANVTVNTSGEKSYVGGLVGEITGGEINQCFTLGTLTATGTESYVAGLVGKNSATITNCYSNATITSPYCAAGIVAYNYGVVDKCYSTGNLFSSNYAAGIIGYNDGADAVVKNCVAMNNKIDVTYESQQQQQGGGYGQRIIGGIKNGAPAPELNNYALKTMQVSVNNVAQKVYDDIMNGVGKNASDLLKASTYQELGWNFTDTWSINENENYPLLKNNTGIAVEPGEDPNQDPEPIVTDDDKIVVTEVTVTKGQQATIGIDLENKTTDLTAYQFDLTLPDGISLSLNEKGKFLVTKTSRYEDDGQTLNISKQEGNTYRFVCFSMSNEIITGTSGAILNASLTIGETVNIGNYEATITNIVVTKQDGTQLKLSDSKFNIVVTNIIKGDANGDGEVNVSDIVEIVNYIMGKPSANFVQAAADLNGDGEVNVTDIVKVVSIIMDSNSTRALLRRSATKLPEQQTVGDDMLSVEPVNMKAGETKQVAIVLNNPTNKYAAFQFDLVLPDGISIAKNNKGKLIASLDEDRKDDHTLNVSETGTNTYRFLAFSMTNTEFYGTDGALVYVTLQADEDISGGNKTATIQSQVFTEVSGEQHKWNDTAFQITIEASTGVKDLMTNGKPFDVYNTLGNLVRRNVTTLQGLLAGVYVVNGHKIVVK